MVHRRYFVLALLGALTAFTQQPQPPDTRFRVSTNLVEVDAAITDSKGRSVPGLKLEDFEAVSVSRGRASGRAPG